MLGNILNIALLVCIAILIVLFGKNKIYEEVAKYVDLAEDYSTVGSEKFNWCVAQLRSLLPKPLQYVFTDKVVGEIVDNVYQYMRSLAKKRMEQIEENKSINEPEKN